MAQEVSRNSFDAAVDSVERTTGGKVPKRQGEEIAVEISEDFVEFYEKRQMDAPEETSEPLIMSEDGKGIVMRKDSLREATRKAAEKKTHQGRLSKGEKRNRKRMAMVGTALNGIVVQGKKQASLGQCGTRAWRHEALRRDPERRREWVMLVDGHQDQLKHIRACMKRHHVALVLILDFISRARIPVAGGIRLSSAGQ